MTKSSRPTTPESSDPTAHGRSDGEPVRNLQDVHHTFRDQPGLFRRILQRFAWCYLAPQNMQDCKSVSHRSFDKADGCRDDGWWHPYIKEAGNPLLTPKLLAHMRAWLEQLPPNQDERLSMCRVHMAYCPNSASISDQDLALSKSQILFICGPAAAVSHLWHRAAADSHHTTKLSLSLSSNCRMGRCGLAQWASPRRAQRPRLCAAAGRASAPSSDVAVDACLHCGTGPCGCASWALRRCAPLQSPLRCRWRNPDPSRFRHSVFCTSQSRPLRSRILGIPPLHPATVHLIVFLFCWP